MSALDSKAGDLTSQRPPSATDDEEQLDKSEFEGMIRGEMYSAGDLYIQKIAGQEAAKVRAINAETDDKKRMRLLRDFMGIGDEVDFYWIGPLFAEYVGAEVSLHQCPLDRDLLLRPSAAVSHHHVAMSTLTGLQPEDWHWQWRRARCDDSERIPRWASSLQKNAQRSPLSVSH